MSDLGRWRGSSSKERRSGNAIYEEIVPPFWWNQDLDNHWLLLNVPGFRREEVTLEVDTGGLIKICGERKTSDIKYVWFEQIFQSPENSKPEDCRVGLENGVFYVIIPKQSPKVQVEKKFLDDDKIHKDDVEKEDSDHEKGKMVNESVDFPIKNEGKIEKEEIPDATPPIKTPKDEGLDIGKGKKENDNNGDFSKKSEGIIGKEEITAPVPDVETLRGEDFDIEKGKKVNDLPRKNCWTKVAKKVKENKGLFLIIILAFSFGVLTSQNKLKKVKTSKRLLVKLDSENDSNTHYSMKEN